MGLFDKVLGGVTGGLLGGGFDDFLLGTDYSKKQKKDQASVFGPLGKGLASQQAAARASLLKALQAQQQGFGMAQGAIAQQGALGQKAIMDASRQRIAQSQMSLYDRGFDGSSLGLAAERANSADTNAALSDLNAQLAALNSDVQIGKGNALAGAYGDLASLDQNYSQLLLSYGLGQAGSLSNLQYGKQGGALNDILKIGATVLGGKL